MRPVLRRCPCVAWIVAGVVGLAAPASFAVAELEPAEGIAAAADANAAEAGFVGPDARVARSTFARDVVDREPVDPVEALDADDTEISYFTELRGLEGTRVVHRWSFEGVVVAEVPFDVGGAHWRVHSRKQLDPTQAGDWTVFVVDESGRTLSEQTLRYLDH